MKKIKNNLTVNIVFDGYLQDLVDFLESKGIDVEAAYNSSASNYAVLVINDTKQEEKVTENDDQPMAFRT
jgi:hypothetical protein